MSRETIETTARLASDAAVEICWKQWSTLGSLASPVGEQRARAIIDPEALLLLSHYLSRRERRLLDLLAWWADSSSELVSVQRFRTLAETFPHDTGKAALSTFAAFASEAGDRRWTRHSGQGETPSARSDKGPDEPGFVEPATLWVRLRSGLGVGAKADVLTFLLGLQGSMARVKIISTATGYSSVAVRAATSEMARARLIRKVSGHPTEYFAPTRPWVELLELYPPNGGPEAGRNAPNPPPWRPWSGLFALLATVMEWNEEVREKPNLGDRVLASRARDHLEEHRNSIAQSGIQLPSSLESPGSGSLNGFRETLERLVDWMTESV